MSKRSDAEIIQKYLEGDKKSLEALIKRYLKRIYAFVYKNVRDSSDAEDVTQEVFLKVWKNIRKFDQSRNFKVWIFEIAKNSSIDFLRKKKTIPLSRFEDEKGQNSIADNISAPVIKLGDILDNKNALKMAMEGLASDDKRIIDLKHKDNLNFREIAELLETSINTVKSKYRRAIIRIREIIRL